MVYDCVRLRGFRYEHNSDMDDLENQLKKAQPAVLKIKSCVTDGVFSMDGYHSPIGSKSVTLLRNTKPWLWSDECHSTGFM